MTTLIDRLRDATENDHDLFMEAYEMYAKQKGHEWRERTLLLIRDRAFLDAASMFAVEGWAVHLREWRNYFCAYADPEFCGRGQFFIPAKTEANARLAMWLTVLEKAQ